MARFKVTFPLIFGLRTCSHGSQSSQEILNLWVETLKMISFSTVLSSSQRFSVVLNSSQVLSDSQRFHWFSAVLKGSQ